MCGPYIWTFLNSLLSLFFNLFNEYHLVLVASIAGCWSLQVWLRFCSWSSALRPKEATQKAKPLNTSVQVLGQVPSNQVSKGINYKLIKPSIFFSSVGLLKIYVHLFCVIFVSFHWMTNKGYFSLVYGLSQTFDPPPPPCLSDGLTPPPPPPLHICTPDVFLSGPFVRWFLQLVKSGWLLELILFD